MLGVTIQRALAWPKMRPSGYEAVLLRREGPSRRASGRVCSSDDLRPPSFPRGASQHEPPQHVERVTTIIGTKTAPSMAEKKVVVVLRIQARDRQRRARGAYQRRGARGGPAGVGRGCETTTMNAICKWVRECASPNYAPTYPGLGANRESIGEAAGRVKARP